MLDNGSYDNTFNEFTPTITPRAGFATNHPSQTNFCMGTCVNFIDTSTNFPIIWNWSFANGFPNTSNVQRNQSRERK